MAGNKEIDAIVSKIQEEQRKCLDELSVKVDKILRLKGHMPFSLKQMMCDLTPEELDEYINALECIQRIEYKCSDEYKLEEGFSTFY